MESEKSYDFLVFPFFDDEGIWGEEREKAHSRIRDKTQFTTCAVGLQPVPALLPSSGLLSKPRGILRTRENHQPNQMLSMIERIRLLLHTAERTCTICPSPGSLSGDDGKAVDPSALNF